MKNLIFISSAAISPRYNHYSEYIITEWRGVELLEHRFAFILVDWLNIN